MPDEKLRIHIYFAKHVNGDLYILTIGLKLCQQHATSSI